MAELESTELQVDSDERIYEFVGQIRSNPKRPCWGCLQAHMECRLEIIGERK